MGSQHEGSQHGTHSKIDDWHRHCAQQRSVARRPAADGASSCEDDHVLPARRLQRAVRPAGERAIGRLDGHQRLADRTDVPRHRLQGRRRRQDARRPGAADPDARREGATHNANSVGPGKPFVPGFYYEVVLEADDYAVLPSVHVWQDHANTVIPGTLISPGTFVGI